MAQRKRGDQGDQGDARGRRRTRTPDAPGESATPDWYGANDVRVEQVRDPVLLNPRDAIVRVTSTAICGSDLHLYHGYIPTMSQGDILGHEFMGEVVDVGPEIQRLKKGDRVVVPFAIACGRCFFCARDLWSLCDNSNPNARAAETLYGSSGAGLFGYSHLYGGYAGGQAEYVRVPFADVGALVVPDDVTDEQALFLSDVLPTGWMAAEQCGLGRGDIVAVWGAGPVGQFAVKSAWLTHRLPLAQAPRGYRMFAAKADGCVKVVLSPDAVARAADGRR